MQQEQYKVHLESFEGPLDLLLYLIRKQNLDILNIPVAEITRQYITYIELMQVLNIDLAAEYLLMAALLAEIKSRLLLPKPAVPSDEEEDPRHTHTSPIRSMIDGPRRPLWPTR